MGFGPADQEDELPAATGLTEDLEARLQKLPVRRQRVWMDTFEQVLDDTGDREQAEKLAWADALTPDELNDEEEPHKHRHSGEASR